MILVDIIDSNTSTRLGPITSATSIEFEHRLDESGEFTIIFMISDPRLGIIQHGCMIEFKIVTERIIIAFQGIVKRINYDANQRQLIVSGFDLMIKLSDKIINLELFDLTLKKPYVIYKDKWANLWVKWATFDNNTATGEELSIEEPDEYLAIGYPTPFSQIDIEIVSGNINQMPHAWQYYNGNWEPNNLPSLVDGTISNLGAALNHTGSISFDIPEDWKKRNFDGLIPVNSYFIRIDPQYWHGESIVFTPVEFSVLAKGPTLDDLQPIFSLLNWTLDPNYFTSTEAGTRIGFFDVTALAALNTMAEHHGHHFRLGSGHKIQWLGQASQHSGIRAIQASGYSQIEILDQNVCLILSLRKSSEDYDLITRVRPFGGGRGKERATLALSNHQFFGFTIDKENNWMISDQAEANGSIIEAVETFGHIAPLTDLLGNEEISDAGNELARAAWTWLTSRDKIHVVYEIEVLGFSKKLKPGDLIHINYIDAVGDFIAHSIKEDLFILAVKYIYDQSHILRAKLTVSNIARYPRSGANYPVRNQRELAHIARYGA